jgi:hypothetical protein
MQKMMQKGMQKRMQKMRPRHLVLLDATDAWQEDKLRELEESLPIALPYHVRLLYSHFDGQDEHAPIGCVPLPHVWLALPGMVVALDVVQLASPCPVSCVALSSDAPGAMGTVATESCEGCAC